MSLRRSMLYVTLKVVLIFGIISGEGTTIGHNTSQLVSTTQATNLETVSTNATVPTNVTATFNSSATTYGYHNASQATTKRYVFKRWKCYDGPKPRSKYQKECCWTEMTRFEDRWYNGGSYLTSLLERLQRWECEEFRDECRKPTYAFTDFTKLVYDRFCNRTAMESKCVETLRTKVQQYGFIQPPPREKEIAENRWSVLTESINTVAMHLDDLTEPCVQIALFDRKSGGVGRFHEIVEPYLPFCEVVWSGYDVNTVMTRSVSPWTSMSIRCRAGIAACIVIMAVAGVATIVASATIISVFVVTPKLRNSQAIYKMSLALADLLVGMMVWPNMIVLQWWLFMSPSKMGNVVTPYSDGSNGTWVAYFPNIEENLTSRYSGGAFSSFVPRPYLNFFGFFTTLGLVVSIYTLMTASFDRFSAVFRPLRYNKHNAKRQAKIVSLIVWIISAAMCVLPIFIDSIKYRAISSIFVSSDGTNALALLLVAFLIPLIITWVITIATFQSSKRHARNRQRIVSANNSSSASLETRLARTLALMVGIFSISVMPAILCIVSGFFLTNTLWSRPKDLDLTAALVYTSFEYVAIIFLTANSLWNCFIYSLRTHGFRAAAASIYKKLLEKAGIKYIGRGARRVVLSARRVSLSSLYAVRKFSSASDSDSRKKSVSSVFTAKTDLSSARPSVDYLSSSIDPTSTSDIGAYSTTYAKGKTKVHKTTSSGVELRAERKKQQKDECTTDTSFGSFAIDSGASRFFHSVMENVEELVEE